MKTLISARTVRDCHAQGHTKINVSPGEAIVTPEARSTAAELGISLVDSAHDAGPATGKVSAGPGSSASDATQNSLRQAIRTQVQAKLPPGQFSDAQLDEVIDRVMNEESRPEQPQSQPKAQQHKHYTYQTVGGIKRIDAASIDFGSFADNGDGGVGVADVITGADNSALTAGYMTWTQCFFPWDLTHDEINIVLEGELHIRADGQELICRAGDAVFIPKGSHLEIGTPSSTRFLYVTHASRTQKA